ncbi:MAG: hypothetical protein AAFP09_20010 [Cyanobacteria bacterium J06607_10]
MESQRREDRLCCLVTNANPAYRHDYRRDYRRDYPLMDEACVYLH